MRGFITLVNRLSQVVGVLAAAMVVVAVVITCQMIFIRYFLNGSTYWHTEAVVYLRIGCNTAWFALCPEVKGPCQC